MLKILIADDHEIVRRGLKQILQEEYPFAHIGEAGDGGALVDKALAAEWDIVISDLAMPVINGLEALRRIKKIYPDLPVLILSIYSENQYAMGALQAGASGYLSKEMAQDELVKAVRMVLSGRNYVSPVMALSLKSGAAIPDDTDAHLLLSERELSVMVLLASGKPVTEIAETLSLGMSTISTYRARILEKMNMKSNAEITRYAMAHKLI